MSACSVSEPHVLIKRFKPGVGRSGGRSACVRPLVRGRGASLRQPQGAIGCGESIFFFGLRKFLRGHVVAVLSDNTTAVSYLRHQGGSLSPTLNEVAQRILRWAEREETSICPQFVPGRNNVVADTLCRPNQVVGTEWTRYQEVFDSLCRRWPMMVDLFASSLNYRCGLYFALVLDPVASGTDAMLQSWDFLEGYAFPLFTMIPQVLRKLRDSKGAVITLIALFWLQREWFPDLLELLLEPPPLLLERWDLLRQLHVRIFHRDCPCFVFMRGDYQAICASLQIEWLEDLALPGGLRR